MRIVLVLIAVSAPGLALAQSKDGGVPSLSEAACASVVEHMMGVTLADVIAQDAEAKKMTPKERELTTRMAKTDALNDPKFDELKKHCMKSYEKKHESCLLKAQSTKELDACAAPLPRGR